MKHLFFLFVFFISTAAHSQIITTIAGNDSFGFSGDGGPATAAKMKQPWEARPDGAGNVYIADVLNNRIRKVNATGIITTIAGNLGPGTLSGSGVPATASVLDGPRTVLVDTAGNIYFGETTSGFGSGSACVMKIYTSGIMVIFAGGGFGLPGSGDSGPATAGVLQNISDISLDRAGNIYIVDPGKNNIRKVDTTGIITTVAGNGTYGFSGDGGPATAAQLYQPNGIAIDNVGNIYIADLVNQRIRKVDTAGIITTIAGDSTTGYTGDGGPATAAALHNPEGVAVDSMGSVYIADEYNSRIRKITAGIISTVAGDSSYGHTGDGGPATGAEMWSPAGVALDAAGNIYITDKSNNDVRKVTMPLPVTTRVAPPGLSAAAGEEELSIWPDPNEGSFTVSLSSNTDEEVQVVITNIVGEKIKEIKTTTNKQTAITLDAPAGVYFVSAATAAGRQCGKVVVR